MDADAQSGLLIGLTQVYPNGTHYGQFKEGGTSLASPLLAGVIADADQAIAAADQAAGVPFKALGFLEPDSVHGNYTQVPGGVQATSCRRSNPNSAAVIRVDYANTVDSQQGIPT